MYGPVPIGCCVPNVPCGWKTPFESTVPASALYFLSAVGLAIPKFVSASAPRIDDAQRLAVRHERPVDDHRVGRRAEHERVARLLRARTCAGRGGHTHADRRDARE